MNSLVKNFKYLKAYQRSYQLYLDIYPVRMPCCLQAVRQFDEFFDVRCQYVVAATFRLRIITQAEACGYICRTACKLRGMRSLTVSSEKSCSSIPNLKITLFICHPPA